MGWHRWRAEAALIAGFAAMTAALAAGAFLNADVAVRDWCDAHRPEPLRLVAKALSFLGSANLIASILLVLAGFLAVRGRTFRPVLPVVAAAMASYLVVVPLRVLTDRSAPHAPWYDAVELFANDAGWSYPSGHVINTLIWYPVLVLLVELLLRRQLPARIRRAVLVVPVVVVFVSRVRPWEWGSDVGHLWRTTGDIRANYASMSRIAKFNLPLADFAGPGHWNDPDMLQVGNAAEQGGSWNPVEQRAHFSLWAMMAAPLLIGTDLRNATADTLGILRNRDVIAVDQDPLGIQGKVVRLDEAPAGGGQYVIAKPLAGSDVAVALWNDTAMPAQITTSASEVGAPDRDRYLVRDLWTKRGAVTAGEISAMVPAHGTAVFRVMPVPPG